MTNRIDDAPLDNELAARFARLERVEAPDNWERVTVLVEAPANPAGSHQRRWPAAAGVILVAGAVVALVATRGENAPTDLASAPDVASAPVAPVTSVLAPANSVPEADVEVGIDTARFGAATVAPERAGPGDIVTVTPDGTVQPSCTDMAGLFSVSAEDGVRRRLGLIGRNGEWTPESDEMVFPACLPAETDNPVSLVIPASAPAGTFAVCGFIDYSDETCGLLEIVEPAWEDASQDAPEPESEVEASFEVPVVDGLTEGEAVTRLRGRDLRVLVERSEVDPGDPNDGRVISQDPAAATVARAGDTVRITVGQAATDAADEL